MTTSTALIEPKLFFTHSSYIELARWQFNVEASCWVRSLCKDNARIKFYIEYQDAVRLHKQLIDAFESSYFQDSLLSGNFQISGFGEMQSISVMVESLGPIEWRNLHVKRAGASQRFRLYAA